METNGNKWKQPNGLNHIVKYMRTVLDIDNFRFYMQ